MTTPFIETPSPLSTPAQAGSSSFWRRLSQVVLLMLGIQAARAAVIWLQWTLLQPGSDPGAWNRIDLVAYLLVGAALLAIFRPSPRSLGLTWRDASRREKIITLLCGAAWLVLVLTTGFISTDMLAENLKAAIAIPIFEELIFRGWIWQKLEGGLSGRYRGLLTYLTVSILFALWHIGYMDIYLIKVAPSWPDFQMGSFLVMKVLTTLVIGVMVGFFRWRTGRVYGSVILHGMINLFGR